MSGGKFDYEHYKIAQIADEIQSYIDKNGRAKTPEELKQEYWRDASWYKKYPEDLKHPERSPEVIQKLTEAVALLRKAYIYANRIDYLLSGDDAEPTFLSRLDKELEKLDKN